MVKIFALLCLFAVACMATEQVIQPKDTSGFPIALVLVAETGVKLSAYAPLADDLQTAFQADQRSLWVVLRDSVEGVETTLAGLKTDNNVNTVVFGSHAMDAGAAVQEYVKANPKTAVAQVLLAGFLQRIQRPDVVECMKKAAIKPKISKAHPLGFLEDGVHACSGPNKISYPVPTLSIGGELDGVVRVARLAEAHYTQTILDNKARTFPVVVVAGMNHASLLADNALPAAIAKRDIAGELSSADARAAVAKTVSAFVKTVVTTEDNTMSFLAMNSMLADTKDLLAPLVEAFVKQEGNWFFTGNDDETGSSAWAASAQELMVDPLPKDQAESWKSISNEFHLLSDEDRIPPYYRGKHRADIVISGSNNGTFAASTVAQLRYIEITVLKTAAGLNGCEIIQEEKVNILHKLKDDGADFVSAIEIGTKMVSRQWLYNHTGHDSPDTLDTNTQCKDINQKAYEYALEHVTPAQKKRFEDRGIKLVMDDDKKPLIPAGPWWIWNYLKWTPTDNEMHLQSFYAFFSLDANPYGAGNHYCKLLSPARAMEWIITDGLRK